MDSKTSGSESRGTQIAKATGLERRGTQGRQFERADADPRPARGAGVAGLDGQRDVCGRAHDATVRREERGSGRGW